MLTEVLLSNFDAINAELTNFKVIISTQGLNNPQDCLHSVILD